MGTIGYNFTWKRIQNKIYKWRLKTYRNHCRKQTIYQIRIRIVTLSQPSKPPDLPVWITVFSTLSVRFLIHQHHVACLFIQRFHLMADFKILCVFLTWWTAISFKIKCEVFETALPFPALINAALMGLYTYPCPKGVLSTRTSFTMILLL